MNGSQQGHFFDEADVTLLDKNGTSAPADQLLSTKRYTLVYLSAHWCPPCRGFTPVLREFYKSYAATRDFTVVFMSCDHSQQEMEEYFMQSHGDWYCLPYPIARRLTPIWMQRYGCLGIPTLLVFENGPTRRLITKRGRDMVLQDKQATRFPWHNADEIAQQVPSQHSLGALIETHHYIARHKTLCSYRFGAIRKNSHVDKEEKFVTKALTSAYIVALMSSETLVRPVFEALATPVQQWLPSISPLVLTLIIVTFEVGSLWFWVRSCSGGKALSARDGVVLGCVVLEPAEQRAVLLSDSYESDEDTQNATSTLIQQAEHRSARLGAITSTSSTPAEHGGGGGLPRATSVGRWLSAACVNLLGRAISDLLQDATKWGRTASPSHAVGNQYGLARQGQGQSGAEHDSSVVEPESYLEINMTSTVFHVRVTTNGIPLHFSTLHERPLLFDSRGNMIPVAVHDEDHELYDYHLDIIRRE